MTPLLASVVIPTCNRPQAIERCLDALAEQTLPPGSFEVIVIDDGSQPALVLDPKRGEASFLLKVIHQNNTGPAGARQRGVTEARGEFLAFTDDDCLPTPTWLEKLVIALRENPETMIGGSTFNGLKKDFFAETSQLILEMVYEHFNSDPANSYFFASNNIALRRDRYLAGGGFDPDFELPAAEDRDFCDRWRMQSRPLVWQKDALVEHQHAQNLSGFCHLYFRYGQGAFLYQAKRKKRASGTMAEDLSFHRSLPKVVLQKIRNRNLPEQIKILTAFFLWQVMNTAGFFRALCRTSRRI
ncbi:MAG: glycosyltransferase family A protein [Pirellulales bacterium]